MNAEYHPTEGSKIGVVIPCYRVRDKILGVIAGLPGMIDAIYVVDDRCPEQSGEWVRQQCADPRVRVLSHPENRGVGGALQTGYREALADECTVVVKMDGDGQMDPAYLPRLLNPILAGQADFTKGNRFYDLTALRQMPLARRIGNLGLTFLTKAASGFWQIADPTNGYTAVHASALRLLNCDRLARRYFFETSMLIQLNIVRAVAFDVPVPARYGNETSSLNLWRTLFGFPPRLVAGFFQRLVWRYFIYDLNAVSVLLAVGSLSTAGGVGFGLQRWIRGAVEARFQSAGTVALALLPTILGMQMLLEALLMDVVDRPRAPLQTLLRDRLPCAPTG